MEMTRVRMTFRLLAMLAAIAMPVIGADDLKSYLAAVGEKLDPRAVVALNRLDGTGRQLLAARSYLRNADGLADDWSWSQQQIDAYQGSPAQQRLNHEIDRVRREFESKNRGFTLFVNPQIRSLDVQIEHWNSNRSVAVAAEELLAAATTFLATGAIPEASTAAGRDSFAKFLLSYTPARSPSIAAPGLSRHGQLRAVDFQISRDGNIVAGSDTEIIESVWLRAGWRDKLAAAVIASGAQFVGPLEEPDEPWHYTYCERGSALCHTQLP
jgi:hypothetical protein